MTFDEAAAQVKRQYAGCGWPSLFARIRFFTAPFRELEPLVPRSGFIVDLGCGYGLFSHLLSALSPERRILGLELDESKLRHADRSKPQVTFDHRDITDCAFEPADGILLIHVLHHLNSKKEQEHLLAVCRDKLRPGGILLICEIDDKPWWKFLLTKLADHMLYPGDRIYYRFPERLLPLLRNLGFEVTHEPSHQGTPFSHVTYLCTRRA